jgi:hypothetical protein
MGGISVNSCRTVCCPWFSTVGAFAGAVLERRGLEVVWLVFGTLLGPEATGLRAGVLVLVPGVCLFLVSWLRRSCMVCLPLWGLCVGVWYGVVV